MLRVLVKMIKKFRFHKRRNNFLAIWGLVSRGLYSVTEGQHVTGYDLILSCLKIRGKIAGWSNWDAAVTRRIFLSETFHTFLVVCTSTASRGFFNRHWQRLHNQHIKNWHLKTGYSIEVGLRDSAVGWCPVLSRKFAGSIPDRIFQTFIDLIIPAALWPVVY